MILPTLIVRFHLLNIFQSIYVLSEFLFISKHVYSGTKTSLIFDSAPVVKDAICKSREMKSLA